MDRRRLASTARSACCLRQAEAHDWTCQTMIKSVVGKDRSHATYALSRSRVLAHVLGTCLLVISTGLHTPVHAAQDLPPDDGAPPEEHGPILRAQLDEAQDADFAVPPPADNAFPISGRTRSSCSDNFGEPRSGGRTHLGVDCFAPLGTPLVAVEAGTIRYATAGDPFSCTSGGDISGNRVSLRGRSGYVYYYGHLNTIAVVTDQPVEKGQVIGTLGRSGNAACSSAHLHFEMKCGDERNTVGSLSLDGNVGPDHRAAGRWCRRPLEPTTPASARLRLAARDGGAPSRDGHPRPAQVSFSYGMNTYHHLLCDFDGDGADGIVVFDRGNWYIRSTATAGFPEIAFGYGIAGYIPVCGDWDGDGDDGIGVYDGGRWYLRHGRVARITSDRFRVRGCWLHSRHRELGWRRW